ncbi:hypothetical protein MMC19_005603 [Ptychographa xylographoides]|nr:hypothetical protein [Ptychographa xylographoides]
MAHAHPLPDAFYSPVPQYSYGRSPYSSAPITSTARAQLSSSHQQDVLSQHNRRLKLRNAGFRGPTLPTQRTSPFMGNVTPIQEPFTFQQPTNDENSPRSTERRALYGEDLPPSPVSILQEISITTRRKHRVPRLGLATIFQDSTATKESEGISTISWYQEADNKASPSPQTSTTQRMMKLREVSINEKPVSARTSGLPKAVKAHHKSQVGSWSRSVEASIYIEYLESELAAMNTKIEAFNSPTRTKAQSGKLRNLTQEVRALRDENAEWENKFAERVEVTLHDRSEVEARLTMRIQSLEDEKKARELRLIELERELENARAKMKDVESVESTNQDLERRVDVLTELLAQSPTRLTSDFTFSTPRFDPSKRTPRPRSLLLPRLQTSPGVIRFPRKNTADTLAWQNCKRNSLPSSSICETQEDMLLSPLGVEQDTSARPGIASQSVSMDSGSDGALNPQSATSLSSRPTSLMSNSSIGASWGLQVPLGPHEDCKSGGRTRKMRRFPSGSCALKPLILPVTTAVTQVFPASVPALGNYETPLRDLSNGSFDPTTAFLSNALDSSPFTTPTQPARQRSATWAQKQTLEALEGRSYTTNDNRGGHHILLEDLRESSCEPDEHSEVMQMATFDKKPQRRSLQMELQDAQKAALEHTLSSPNVAEIIISPEPFDLASELDESLLLVPLPGSIQAERPNDEVPRRLRSPTCSENATNSVKGRRQLVTSPRKVFPTSAVMPTLFLGSFARLNHLVASVSQDPLVSARRILRSAWTVVSSRLGGLGWWLLGLIFGSRRRKQDYVTDIRAVEEEPSIWQDRPTSGHAWIGMRSFSREMKLYRQPISSGSMRLPDGTSETVASIVSPCPLFFGSKGRLESSYACAHCAEPASRRSLRLWLRFSLAIVLAVGAAVKDGPGTLLEASQPFYVRDDVGDSSKPGTDELSSSVATRHEHPTQRPLSSSMSGDHQSTAISVKHPEDPPEQRNDGFWGWEYTFVENLGPADFE